MAISWRVIKCDRPDEANSFNILDRMQEKISPFTQHYRTKDVLTAAILCLNFSDQRVDSVPRAQQGDRPMGLTRSLNVLMICAAFAFVAAMVVGIIP
ncbi:hypothetical protein ACFO1V_03545 [Daeguia caeni]|uniref:Uncharacterized protein n=1 Tax=Daeguia caeni TaxID=439612 RepID=A0ABV9H5T2_9HYPH